MTGGGFGGCVVALIPEDILVPGRSAGRCATVRSETGIKETFYVCKTVTRSRTVLNENARTGPSMVNRTVC